MDDLRESSHYFRGGFVDYIIAMLYHRYLPYWVL